MGVCQSAPSDGSLSKSKSKSRRKHKHKHKHKKKHKKKHKSSSKRNVAQPRAQTTRRGSTAPGLDTDDVELSFGNATAAYNAYRPSKLYMKRFSIKKSAARAVTMGPLIFEAKHNNTDANAAAAAAATAAHAHAEAQIGSDSGSDSDSDCSSCSSSSDSDCAVSHNRRSSHNTFAGTGDDDDDDDATNGSEQDPFLNRRIARNISIPNSSDGTDNVQEDLKMKAYQARNGKRNSIVEYIDTVRRHQMKQLDFLQKKRSGTLAQEAKQNVVFLNRGGTYVQTAAGPVQFGMPPETIKDSMLQGLTLPSNFVLPKERFNLTTGINVAEFEFPAYFNFFVLRKRINLITTREVEPLIRTIFQETLLGPKSVEWPMYFADNCPKENYPDIEREMAHFNKNPFNPSEKMSVDTLIEFTYFEDGVAKLSKGVSIVDKGEEYTVLQGEDEVATVSGHVILSPPPLAEHDNKDEDGPTLFVPPVFGITMLGNSHGFDASGTTTGFVLWMNRRGIMVDPPPHSGAILKQHGIPPRLIQGVIVTHCHADHDAGTFQKILEEGKVMLYTTPVILGSFLRKYSAISGLAPEFLEQLFDYREVIIGERMSVYGGYIEFHASLHSIPCVGFSAFCNGKSMIYSGDTFNDPAGIDGLCEKGVLSPGRRDTLKNFPWDRTVILHEAGVPPIHTPMATLTSLPADVKERLYVVHVAAKDIPADSGLKSCGVGPEHTIVISDDRGPHLEALEVLDLVSQIDLFEDFPIERSVDILASAEHLTYEKGDVIIQQGSHGESLYVTAMGMVAVWVGDVKVKSLTVGDHFGEMSILTKQPRTASIIAETRVECIVFSGPEFMHLVRETTALNRLAHLGLMQREESWQTLNCNSVFGSLSSSQKTYLQSILHKRDAFRGELLWEKGEDARIAVLVESGKYVFSRAKHLTPFSRGAFVGDMAALLYSKPISTTLVCIEDGTFYYITKKNLLKFFEDNPGVLVHIKDSKFTE
jgi:CRP-like cAMP-binding protein